MKTLDVFAFFLNFIIIKNNFFFNFIFQIRKKAKILLILLFLTMEYGSYWVKKIKRITKQNFEQHFEGYLRWCDNEKEN